MRDRAERPRIEVRPIHVGDFERLTSVIELAARHKRTLGFMPDAGFVERVEQGTLLVALDGGELVGYALYDLPRQHVRLIHLCVSTEHRGRGVARLLVDEISKKHHDRVGLVARCRRDYAANRMWPALGFTPRGESRGRGAADRILTSWWRSHGHPDLFTRWISEPGLLAIIDLNVFLDLTVRAVDPVAEEALSLTADWLAGQVELAITGQVLVEIYELSDDTERQNQARLAANFQQIDADATRVDKNFELLASRLGGAALRELGRMDVMHVAAAAAAEAHLFVTRDQKLIREIKDLALEEFGLRVVRPSDVVVHLDELARASVYRPAALLDTKLSVATVGSWSEDELVPLIDHSGGERRPTFVRALREDALDSKNTTRLMIRGPEGGVLAYWSFRVNNALLQVRVLRVAARPLQSTLARQVLFQLRQEARKAGCHSITVMDEHVGAVVVGALEEDGYLRVDQRWMAAVVDLCSSYAEICKAVQSNTPSLAAGDEPLSDALVGRLERAWWPAKVIDAGLQNYLVPIRPIWADQLFGLQPDLFGRANLLGISREHVYYRSNYGLRLTAPGRLLWYKSGVGGGVVGCSRLVEVRVDRPANLHSRFQHLGVWQRTDVMRAAARNGLACALRFADTEHFLRRVTLQRLRVIAQNCRMGTLQSPVKIDSETFARLYREGRGR